MSALPKPKPKELSILFFRRPRLLNFFNVNFLGFWAVKRASFTNTSGLEGIRKWPTVLAQSGQVVRQIVLEHPSAGHWRSQGFKAQEDLVGLSREGLACMEGMRRSLASASPAREGFGQGV